MGAWTYVQPRLRASIGTLTTLRYVGRPERASPAEGYKATHDAEQARIVKRRAHVRAGVEEESGGGTLDRLVAASIRTEDRAVLKRVVRRRRLSHLVVCAAAPRLSAQESRRRCVGRGWSRASARRRAC